MRILMALLLAVAAPAMADPTPIIVDSKLADPTPIIVDSK
jgi:hypothetical protein